MTLRDPDRSNSWPQCT